MTPDTPMVRLERFEKRYGKLQAVKPLDLEVARGESFALLGPNGSGKTSILRALVGLHRPSDGRILIDGLDVAESPDRVMERLSYVPQRVTLPDLRTAREVAILFARLQGVPVGRAEEVLDLFALADTADRPTREFSGGMIQRLGLAVAFMRQVPLFVLDEPTVNLDPAGVDVLRELLGKLRRNGTTVVFSSHILHSAMQLADRVAVLVDGELVRLSAASLFRDAVASQMVIRVVLDEATDGVVRAARDAGAEVSHYDARQMLFKALPGRRLEVIRAIERAGATVAEFHTEVPEWGTLIRKLFDTEERSP